MHDQDEPQSPRSHAPHLARLVDYVVAVLATGAILFFEIAFRSYLGTARFFPFTLAVLLASRRGAWGPALLAITLSCLGVNIVLTEPLWSPSLSEHGIFQTALFASVCLGLTALSVDLSRALTELRTEQAERTAAANRERSARMAALASAQARRSAEAELRESEERFRLLVENVQDYAIFALDAAGNIQSWNQGAARIEGFTADEIIGRHVSTFYTEEDRAADKPAQVLAEAAREGRAETEGWRVRKDGSRFYAHVVVTARHDPSTPSRKASNRLRGFSQVTRDMTAQREQEQALREAVARLQGIFDTAVDGIITIDEAGAITAVNQATSRLFGYPASELIGRNIRMLMPSPYLDEHDAYLERYRQSGERKIIGSGREVQGLRRDGSVFPLELSVGETMVAGGRVFTGIVRDITERRLAEDRLRASENRFRATFEQAAVGIAHVMLDGSWLRLNRRYCEILGYTPDEALGLTFQDVTHPDDLDADLHHLQSLIRGEIDTYALEKRYIRKDRTVIWVNLTVAMVRGDGDEPSYFISVVEDIDRKKRAETALRVLADVSAALGTAHGVSDTLAAVGRAVIPAIADTCMIYLRSPEGVTPAAIHHGDPARAERLRELARRPAPPDAPYGHLRVLRTGTPELTTEVTPAMLDALASDPEARAFLEELQPHSWMVVPMKIHGDVVGALGLATSGGVLARRFIEDDLRFGDELARRVAVALENARLYEEATTFNRELEHRVEERTQRLAELNQELEAFSYSVSHDLRAPLRAIAGYCQILAEEHGAALPEAGHDAIQRARAATLRMGQLIDDMLELSRITRAEIRRERVNLSAIAGAIAGELVEHAGERRVEVSIEPGLEVVGDERLLRAALRNLLGNAWKFTARRDPAHIGFGAEDRDGRRVFFVRDDGVGFDMKYAHRLFAPFQRLHAQAAFEGTGIGLATVKRVIVKHGGHVWVDHAAAGEGVTVCFTLGETPA